MDLNRVLPTAELTPLPTELRSSSHAKTSQIDINTNGSNILFPFVVISLLYLVLWIIPLSLYPFVVQFRQIVVLFLYNMNINSPLCCFVSFCGELSILFVVSAFVSLCSLLWLPTIFWFVGFCSHSQYKRVGTPMGVNHVCGGLVSFSSFILKLCSSRNY